MKHRLEQLYRDLGVDNISLMNQCRFCASCWKGTNEGDKKDSDWKIYHPFIGAKYETSKILFVGINMNNYGDANAVENLATCAIKEVCAGKKRTFVDPKMNYIGSLLWHRIFTYSTCILKDIGVIPFTEKQQPTIAELKESYDYIAMTNSIKCSPYKERSKPIDEMWLNCPSFILKEEIKILQPKHLVILGIENFQHIKSLFTIVNNKIKGSVSLIDAQFESNNLTIYVIPHPSSSQGTDLKRQQELTLLLKEKS